MLYIHIVTRIKPFIFRYLKNDLGCCLRKMCKFIGQCACLVEFVCQSSPLTPCAYTLFRPSFNAGCCLFGAAGKLLLLRLCVCVQPLIPHFQDVRHESGSGRRTIPFRRPCLRNLGVKYGHLLTDGRAEVRKEEAKTKISI